MIYDSKNPEDELNKLVDFILTLRETFIDNNKQKPVRDYGEL